MSYLLTEIAMEMLGWQFYDIDGVPRPINLEGANTAVTADSLTLQEALNIKFLEDESTKKVESDSSSREAAIEEEPIDFDVKVPFTKILANDNADYKIESGFADNTHTDGLAKKASAAKKSPTNENPFIMNNTTLDDTFKLKIESVAGGVNLVNLETKANFHTPLTDSESKNKDCLETQPPTAEALAAITKSKPNYNFISTTKTPIQQQPATGVGGSSGAGGSSNSGAGSSEQANASTLTPQMYLQHKLESEMFKTALDLNREKSIYYKSLTNETKKNSQEFRKAVETYRSQELQRLQAELQTMYELRLQAEQLAAKKCPKTYPKYLTKSTTLSPTFLESAKLTIPILSTSNLKHIQKRQSLD